MNNLEINDRNFPHNLKKITPKVARLYYKGNIHKDLFKKSVAVVGSRRMTQYGQRIIESLLPPLINAGVTIISGFMYGVDQQAHTITLENGGKTVAVLGWGIDWQVEASDQKLYSEIEKKGLIISEYPDKISPRLWMFPRRNRIMAGLSQAVLVIEAAPNSGSLITADFAKKYAKKLFAVPGPVTSAVSQGTNMLIKLGIAKMATSADDILNEMKWTNDFKQPCSKSADKSDILLQLLANEPLTVDEIALSTNQSIANVSVKLSLLQLNGQVEEKDGKYYCKIKI